MILVKKSPIRETLNLSTNADSRTDTRAAKLKISWEEWDYCFHFSLLEVLDFVKKNVWNVEILHLDTLNIRCFFVNVFLCNILSSNCYHKHDIYNWLKGLFCRCTSVFCFFLKCVLFTCYCIAFNIIYTWRIM